MTPRSVAFFLFASTLAGASAAQSTPRELPEGLLDTMAWRQVGPFRGGRASACCGVPGDRNTYYFGACGGGVWKTRDAGRTWRNVSDGFFGGSIGAVAVSEYDPNVVYAGGGEETVRGNVSHGEGVWKSLDAGKTWVHMGLSDSRHITRIRIHPRNPELVFVAALGHLFGPNPQRGVFRSKDGGRSWQRVLFANENAGAVDLCFDPTNPRIVYASTWRVRRTPYSLVSGGEGCALWKSVDGGDTWIDVSKHKGMPKGTLGKIGVAVSPANPERVWALVEAEKGGVFRSEDAGKTWKLVNSERKLRQRAWYYTRIYADPKDADVCYVLNVGFHRSKDGGKTFSRVRTPHGDNHDLWIAPEDPARMIEANDGGANLSFDRGRTWSALDNQPTAQFYRVTTDNHVPYRIYGAQQDNSAIRIAHRGRRGSIGERDWESTAGGESGHLAPHPKDPEIVFGGSYDGYLIRVNHRTGEIRNVNVWPDNPMGWGAAKLKYRFQWNFPIFFSPHEPYDLFAAGNVLFRSRDGGGSWMPISPDLTRNEKSTQASSGGPITKDNTSVEYYGTIFAACESPREPGLFWCGSDDGRIHVSRDAGKSWRDVTPKDMPEWMQINAIEPHPFADGGLYVAGTRYKSDDFAPYLYRTTDYGASWTKITTGIPDHHFTRVVRADPKRAGLLYAGTERGVYVSFDDGASWRSLQLKLPIVPITDLCIRDDDLIAATQGRAFWVLDDLTPLQQVNSRIATSELFLLKPRRTYRLRGGRGGRKSLTRGTNPPGGVVFRFFCKQQPTAKAEVTLEILDSQDRSVRKFSTKAKKDADKLKVKKGFQRFEWDMRYLGAVKVPKMVLWGGGTGGPLVVPGTYRARLAVAGDGAAAGKSMTVSFEILKDPRSSATQADLVAQRDFLLGVRDKLSETHNAILRVRRIRTALAAVKKRAAGTEGEKDIQGAAMSLEKKLAAVEQALYQTKNRSSQDPLNFPIRLGNKLSALVGVVGTGDWAPTKQAVSVRDALTQRIDAELDKLRAVVSNDLPAFNELARRKNVPAVSRK